MGRTVSEIKKIMTDATLTDSTMVSLLSLDPSKTWESQVSSTNIISLVYTVVAICMFMLEALFGEHKLEVDNKIATLKPHKKAWYKQKMLQFQYGRALVTDMDYYDNAGLTDEEIDAEKIIKYAAVEEAIDGLGVRLDIKVAKVDGDDLSPLSESDPNELAPALAYINEVKDAGVRIAIVNRAADYFKAEIDIYYNPIILDASGRRLDGASNTPVQDAVKEYLRTLPFNGIFITAHMVDKLQEVEGADIPEVLSVEAKYGGYGYQSIRGKYKPDAGYLRIYDEGDLTLNFIANV